MRKEGEGEWDENAVPLLPPCWGRLSFWGLPQVGGCSAQGWDGEKGLGDFVLRGSVTCVADA